MTHARPRLPSPTPAQRRALRRALGGYGCALAPSRDEPGPSLATWRTVMERGWVTTIQLPSYDVPSITDAGVAALGLPTAVADPVAALRIAVASLLPWETPEVRVGDELPDDAYDDVDSDLAPPRVPAGDPRVLAAVDATPEDDFEVLGGAAEEGWDAVTAWMQRLGHPVEPWREGDWVWIYRDDP